MNNNEIGLDYNKKMDPGTTEQSQLNNNSQENGHTIFARHFGQAFEIQTISDGDIVPVGGDSIFSNELTKNVKVDFEHFEDFFHKVGAYAESVDLDKTRQGLEELNMDISAQLFVKLLAFTKIFIREYSCKPGFRSQNSDSDRDNLYRDKTKTITLSEIYNNNLEECSEIAILAQKFLQNEGISSSIFNGEVLWNHDGAYGEPHSFIIIRTNEKKYIFDPTNPTYTKAGNSCPSIYVTEKDFDEEIGRGKKVYLTAINLRSGEKVFFGAGNQTEIISEEHIV